MRDVTRHLVPSLVEALDLFRLRESRDPVKRELEIVCDACGDHVCDVEPGDSVSTLAHVVVGHLRDVCQGPSADRNADREISASATRGEG